MQASSQLDDGLLKGCLLCQWDNDSHKNFCLFAQILLHTYRLYRQVVKVLGQMEKKPYRFFEKFLPKV